MDSLLAVTALKVLDGLSLRSAVTAENIANAATAGYQPRKVTFEDALLTAARQGPQKSRPSGRPSWRSLQPQTPSGRVDLELATASGTQGRYSAVVDVLNRTLQIRSLAVSGGK